MDYPFKHTKFQPSMEEWRRPKCGMDHGVFTIETGCVGPHTASRRGWRLLPQLRVYIGDGRRVA